MKVVVPKDMEDWFHYQWARLKTIRAKIEELEVERRLVIQEMDKAAQQLNKGETATE